MVEEEPTHTNCPLTSVSKQGWEATWKNRPEADGGGEACMCTWGECV